MIESENEMKTSLLAEKDKKIKELNLNETDRLKSICESLQIESDKCKVRESLKVNENFLNFYFRRNQDLLSKNWFKTNRFKTLFTTC